MLDAAFCIHGDRDDVDDGVACRNEASLVSYCVLSNVSLLATPSFDETAAALNDSGLALLPINDTQPYFPRETTAEPPRTEPPGTVPPVRSPATPPSVPTQRTESPVPTPGTLPPLPTPGTVQPPAELTTTAIVPPTRAETTSSSPEYSVSQLSASED